MPLHLAVWHHRACIYLGHPDEQVLVACCNSVQSVRKHTLELACNTSGLVGTNPALVTPLLLSCTPSNNAASLHGPANVVASSCQLAQSSMHCHRQSMQICNFTCKDAHKVHESLTFNSLGGTGRLTPSCHAVVGLSDETSGALRIPQPGGKATPHGALQGQLASASYLHPALSAFRITQPVCWQLLMTMRAVSTERMAVQPVRHLLHCP